MGTETTRYRIVLDDGQYNRGIKTSTRNTRGLDNTIKRTKVSANTLGKTMGRALGGLALAAGVYQLGKSIITLGVNMEQTRVSFGTFLGDVEKGNALIKQLTDFATVTPFETSKVLSAGQTLLAFGLEAEKILPTMNLLGDVAAGTGKDFKELAVIYGQIRGAGRLMGQDALQLINAGFNPLKQISDKTGRSMLDLKKDMEAGLISFDMVEKAFKEATSEGGLFFNLMEKQSKTLGGRFSTLVGNLQLLGATIGEGMSDGLGNFVSGMNDFIISQTPNILEAINNISSAFSSFGDTLNDVAKSWGLNIDESKTFGAIIDAMGISVQLVASSLNVVIKGVAGLGQALWGLLQIGAFQGEAGLENIKQGMALTQSGFTDFGEDMMAALLEASGRGIPFAGVGGDKSKSTGLGGATNVTNEDKKLFGGAANNVNKRGSSGGGGVQSRLKNITVNIDKLVENVNFNNITGQQSEAALLESTKRALMLALADVNVLAR